MTERWRYELPSIGDEHPLPPNTQSWTFDMVKAAVTPSVSPAAAREVAVQDDPIVRMLHGTGKARPRR